MCWLKVEAIETDQINGSALFMNSLYVLYLCALYSKGFLELNNTSVRYDGEWDKIEQEHLYDKRRSTAELLLLYDTVAFKRYTRVKNLRLYEFIISSKRIREFLRFSCNIHHVTCPFVPSVRGKWAVIWLFFPSLRHFRCRGQKRQLTCKSLTNIAPNAIVAPSECECLTAETANFALHVDIGQLPRRNCQKRVSRDKPKTSNTTPCATSGDVKK